MAGNRIETWGPTPPSPGQPSGPSDGHPMADPGDVADRRVVRERQAGQAESPTDEREEAFERDATAAEHEGRHRAEEQERGRLAEVLDVEAFHREEQRGDGDGAADEQL